MTKQGKEERAKTASGGTETRALDYVLALSTLDEYPSVRDYLKGWLDHHAERWIELAEICFDICQGTSRDRLDRVLACWLTLFAVAGPLDDLVDRDRDIEERIGLDADQAQFVFLALIAEALGLLIPAEPQEGAPLSRAADVFAEQLRRASLGQAMDLAGVETLGEYERMIELKSASQIQALTEAVATATEAPSELKQALASFGLELGIAVQMTNDYLGIFRPTEHGKKPGGDLNGTKLTYPMLYVLRPENADSREFELLLDAPSATRDIERMLAILDGAGAKEFHSAAIEIRRAAAFAELHRRVSSRYLTKMQSWWNGQFADPAREQ